MKLHCKAQIVCAAARVLCHRVLIGAAAAFLLALPLISHAVDDGITDFLTLPVGSYIVDMGSVSPTVANSLKPYGLVYDLVNNQKIPVWWVINPSKAKDGTDFVDTGSGKSYRGGPFAINASYVTPAVLSTINNWKAQGVIVDGPTTAPTAAVPVYQALTGKINVALDLAKGSIAQAFLTAAGVPASAYRFFTPAALDSCQDMFVMPHADPTWATHGALLSFTKNNRGYIWAGCHAVSVLENIDDPSTPTVNPDMNFLSTAGLVPFTSHGNGSVPYSTARPGDPVMQFIGTTDTAEQNGSEQIYLPLGAGGWRPGARLLVTSPSQADVPALSPGPAAAIIYGRAFDNSQNGMVMYEGGHNVGGTAPANIAAQRAFLNFWLLAQIDRSPTVSVAAAGGAIVLNENASLALSASVNHFTGVSYQWSSSGGGVFSAPNGSSTNFTAPEVTADTPVLIRLTVSDSCGRSSTTVYFITVKNVPKADLAITKTASSAAVGVSTAFSYTLAVSNLGTDTATTVAVTDVLPTGLGFVSATGTGWACTYSAPNLSCTRPNLALTGSTPSTITVNVTAPATTGALVNTATVTSAVPDNNLANNTSSVTTNVVSGIDVAITKTAPGGPFYSGASFSYTLNVRNNGVVPATSLTVDDPLPPALTFVSATGLGWNCVYNSADRHVTCFIASLAAGANSNITLTVIPTGSVGAVIANTAIVSSPDFSDTNLANNSASTSITLSASADLSLSASGSTTGGGGGQIDTHVVTLTNNGPGTAIGIVISDAMSGAGIKNYGAGCTVTATTGTLAPASPWSNAQIQAGGTWSAPTLASGASATLTFSCTGNNNNGVTNLATITSSSFDPNPANNSASNTVIDAATTNVDLSLTKTAPVTVLANSALTYTLTVTNNGPANVTSPITVMDTLPPGVTYTSASGSGFVCSPVAPATGNLSCTTATNVITGSSLTLSILATAPPTAGVITNTASVSAAGNTDPTPGNNNASASTTVTIPSTDIAITKTVNNAAPTLGGNVVFTVIATNNGAISVTNLRVSDVLPSGLTLVSVSTTQGSYDPVTGLWYIGLLNTGAANAKTLTITAAAAQAGVLANQACVYALDQTDSNSANNCATATVTPLVADLRLTKSVDNAAPGINSNVTFTVTLTNLGGSAATAMSVLDALPDGLKFVSASASSGVYNATSGVWSVPGPLANGASAVLTIVATVTVAATPLTNSATITASGVTDPVLSNNSASVVVIGQAADIEVTKSVDIGTPLALNTTLTFTVTVKNYGPSVASVVNITDLLPAGLTYVSHIAGQGSYVPATGLWTVGALAIGASTTLQLKATNANAGLLTNTATRSASTPPDPNATNDTASVPVLSTGAADLSIIKTVDKQATFQGDTVNFTVQLQNTGPNTATGVAVLDLLPAGLTYVSSVASQGSYVSTTGVWSVGVLALGQRVTLTVQATVSGSGALTNTATVSALNQADPDITNNSATAIVSAAAAADLAVTLTGPAGAAVGAPVTYTLAARNNGPTSASGASLISTVPAGITVSTWTCVASGSADCDTTTAGTGASGTGNALSLANVSIPAGAGNFVTVTFTGAATTAGTVTTTAIVSPPVSVFDTNIANNSASVTTVVGSTLLTGRVFADTGTGGGIANDGLLNGGELGIGNVTVRLSNCAATVYGSTVTDGAGQFSFAIPLSLAAGAPLCVIETNPSGYLSTGAQVGNTGGTYARATDTINFTLAVNTAYSGIQFGDVPVNRFAADGQQTAQPGTVVFYAHTFNASSAGTLSLALADGAAGWSSLGYLDNNCNGTLDSGEPAILGALPVSAGQAVCVIVKVSVPANAPFNAQNQTVVTANFNYTTASPALAASYTNTDLTTVGGTTSAGLTLNKAVDKATALPGDVIVYTITYRNNSSGVLNNIQVFDNTPGYTTFISAACSGALPPALSTCAVTTQPVGGGTGNLVWTLGGSLASGAQGVVTFSVKVD